MGFFVFMRDEGMSGGGLTGGIFLTLSVGFSKP